MSPCNTIRSFAISLVIVVAVIETPASSFAIHRTENITDETDLAGEESSILSVRHGQKRPNDINSNDSGKTDSKERLPIESKANSKEVSTDAFIGKITEYTTGPISSLDDFNRKFTSKSNNDFINTQYREVETHTNYPINQFQFTPGIPTSRDNNILYSYTFPSITTAQPETTTFQVQDNNSNAENKGEVTKIIDNSFTTKIITPSPSNAKSTLLFETTTPIYTSTKLNKFTLGSDLTAITLSVDELYSLKDLAGSITETVPIETDTIQNSRVTSLYFTGPTSSTIPAKAAQINRTSDESRSQEETTKHYYATAADSTKLEIENNDSANRMSAAESVNIAPTEPFWRKYTSIDRNQVTSVASITTESELLTRSETETTFNFDQSINSKSTTTASNKMPNDITSLSNKFTTTTEGYTTVSSQDNTPYELTTSNVPPKPLKAGVVSSKMAGFLDFSKPSTPSVDILQSSESAKTETEVTLTTLYEITTVETTTPETKSTKPTESQNQLAEDVINEELLKEELINDNADAKKYREDRPAIPDLKEVKPLAEDVMNINNLASNQSEDSLVVQPINHEKIKNAILYAVSPKYKPMKKIDIQPPKQFVRDPDDNSWRNLSISSLGIVFKPKNPSKSFTQVLKNKTEVELSNLNDRDNKSGVPDLRQRLEKIAEVRKSKKKKINKYGETVYVDYEEGNVSVEVAGLKKKNYTAKISFIDPIFTTTPTTTDVTQESDKNIDSTKDISTTTVEIDDLFKRYELDALTTDKPKKYYNPAEYYDTTDEYDVDYLNMSHIDLKKYTMPSTEVTTTPTTVQTPASIYVPERKPTIQYFPPTTKKVKVNVNDYDDRFQKKVNLYTVDALPKDLRKALSPAPFATMATPPPQTEYMEEIKTTPPGFRPSEFNKNIYFTGSPVVVTEQQHPFITGPEFNRGSYIIKHYKDFINVAAKDDDYRNEFIAFTEPPVKGVTINDLAKQNDMKIGEDDYDYEQQFRKDLINRFVANFNQNSERFKVDFPVLFNSSVIHRKVDEKGKSLAASTAFMKRLYDVATTKSNPYILSKSCEPNCERLTVELSPAYELHYYVPEQEEKQDPEQQPVTIGYHQYRS